MPPQEPRFLRTVSKRGFLGFTDAEVLLAPPARDHAHHASIVYGILSPIDHRASVGPVRPPDLMGQPFKTLHNF